MSFCPYYKIKYNRELLGEFSSSLLKEIRLVAAFIERRKEVGSIYFGGGTPALAIDYLPEVVNLTKSLFDVKGDMGIELHPGDVNPTLLEKLKKIRFNMISLGIQSFKDTCLSVLERDRIDNIASLRMIKDFNFEVIDVDLIFGIPGQSEEDLVYDFRVAVENGATQISTYPFIEFTYAGLKNKPAGREVKKKMLEALVCVSEEMGFSRSSIWTFSKAGASFSILR